MKWERSISVREVRWNNILGGGRMREKHRSLKGFCVFNYLLLSIYHPAHRFHLSHILNISFLPCLVCSFSCRLPFRFIILIFISMFFILFFIHNISMIFQGISEDTFVAFNGMLDVLLDVSGTMHCTTVLCSRLQYCIVQNGSVWCGIA